MNYELIPPTEDFFSHQWYDRLGFGTAMITDDLYSRIDSTRRKLNELEIKLQQRLDSERYNPDLRSFLDRVNWLHGYIGIWTTHSDEWNAEMVYPLRKGHPHGKQLYHNGPKSYSVKEKKVMFLFFFLLLL